MEHKKLFNGACNMPKSLRDGVEQPRGAHQIEIQWQTMGGQGRQFRAVTTLRQRRQTSPLIFGKLKPVNKESRQAMSFPCCKC